MHENKELFDRYKPCDVSYVMMNNGSKNKIMGIGIVKMEMYDGVVRILDDMKHVSNLKKNLILLSRLNYLRYGYY